LEAQQRCLQSATVEGEGQAFKMAVKNADGAIEEMYERIGDEWLVSLERPMHLCRLICVRCADEMWKRNEVKVPTVVITSAP
jgi:hypothetical protein